MKEKQKIRKDILDRLKKQDDEEGRQKSLLIKEKLFAMPEFKKAKTVMFYVSTEFEVDTSSMIDDALKMGKKVAVPYLLPKGKKIVPSFINARQKELEEGPYGIYHPKAGSHRPVSCSDIDVVVVPGIVFSDDGTRIGRGAGYYDRFLKDLSKDTCTIGIAFDFQVVPGLPSGSHDIPVKRLITENERRQDPCSRTLI